MSQWCDLALELDLWAAAGAAATFWWRDDDVVAATPALERLLEHARGTPVALAAIPALTESSLVERLREEPAVTILQHGWKHEGHDGHSTNEYPETRLPADVAWELTEGRARLLDIFGDRFLPVFAPPWHGFDAVFLPLLVQSGIVAISRKGPRAGPWAAEGLFQANAHVAPIRWTDPPSFAEEGVYLAQLVDHLQGRRLGRWDVDEPTGLLTHHLVQTEESYAFMDRLIELVADHPAATWVSAREIFAPSC
jgi:hypothetical protein